MLKNSPPRSDAWHSRRYAEASPPRWLRHPRSGRAPRPRAARDRRLNPLRPGAGPSPMRAGTARLGHWSRGNTRVTVRAAPSSPFLEASASSADPMPSARPLCADWPESATRGASRAFEDPCRLGAGRLLNRSNTGLLGWSSSSSRSNRRWLVWPCVGARAAVGDH